MNISALAYIAVLESTERVALVAERDGDQTVLALVCGGFGMLLVLLVVSALREAVAMKRWPVANGRVLSSTVEQYRDIAGAGDFGSTRTHMTLYRPVVVYEYEAAGQRFKGHCAESRVQPRSAHFCREDRGAISMRECSRCALQSQAPE